MNAPARLVPRDVELAAMRRAIELAGQALGTTSPNPAVGCVILDRELQVAGEGFTSPPGGPHAEVSALKAAGERSRGGIAVVTLEPCNHFGRTPPCTRALVAAGVTRVVFALSDPHPAASGGAEALRKAGVEVLDGVLAAEARPGLEAWLHSIQLGRPFVTWVYGASVDGRVAAADGSSQPINGEEAVADVQGRLRAQSDAVVVGWQTIRNTDPDLSARGLSGAGERRQPRRVVVDPEARVPAGARLLAGAVPALVAVAEEADASHLEGRAEIVRLSRSQEGGGLDPGGLLRAIHERELRAVLLEGEPALAAGLVAAGLVDRVVTYVAPVLIGGGGLPALTGAGASSIDSAWRFEIDDLTLVGTDVRVTAHPRRPAPPGRADGT